MKKRPGAALALTACALLGCASAEGADPAAASPAAAQTVADALPSPVPATTPVPSVEVAPANGRPEPTEISSDDQGRCTRLCVPTGELKCGPVEACVAACLEMMTDGPCPAEFRAFVDCAGRESIAHWECADNATAAIKDGYCQDAQAAFFGCVRVQMSR